LLVALLVAILSIAQAPQAGAHAFLVRSTPMDGSTFDRSPRIMTLTFDEDILLEAGSVTLRSADGSVPLQTGPPAAARPTISDKAGPDLVVALPRLGNGSYSATWRVLSADDLHQTTGTVSFAVGQLHPTRAVDRSGPAPQLLSSMVRWLDLTGIALLLGALLLITAVVPRSRIGPGHAASLRRILFRVVTVTAAAELILGVAVLIDYAGPSEVLGVLTSARVGRLWLVREAGFAAASLSSFLAIPRVQSARPLTITTIGLTFGSLAAIAGSSHVGVGTERPFALLLLLVHLSFAGAWAGAVLLLSLLLVLDCTGRTDFRARRLLRSFGVPAAFCVAVAGVTGIALAARQVASVDAALTTTYGQLLIVKVVAATTAGLLGLRTTIRLRRSRPAGTAAVSRGVAAEGAALLLALAVAAALSVGTPARGPAFAPAPTAGPSVMSAQVGDLLESAAFAPNTVGQSWLRVDVNQTRRPVPGPITGVTAALVGPHSSAAASRSLVKTEIANRWELGGVDLTAAGRWQLTLAVARRGRPDTVWRAGWVVAGAPTDVRNPLVSDRPWESALNDTAAAIAGLLLGAGLIVLWTRRRRQNIPNEPERSSPSQERTLIGL